MVAGPMPGPTTQELKQRALAALDARREEIQTITDQVLRGAELGFREFETARYVQQIYDRLGLPYQAGLALTGIKVQLAGGAGPGPRVAVLGELDALPIPDHPDANPATGATHACGHNAQTAMVLAAAMALHDAGVMPHLSGGVVLFHVPAEEMVDLDYRLNLIKEGKLKYLVGKPELLRLGHFDDVDMAMMVHNASTPAGLQLGVGCTLNGCLVKKVVFHGRAAHAGTSPHLGVNALNAAQLALSAIHYQRETFRDEDSVRVHWIMPSGGTGVNVVPSEVAVDMMVRARTSEPLAEASLKVDRALRAGALAIGARVTIHTMPGYGALLPYPALDEVFRRNGEALVGAGQVLQMAHRAASTDLGDLSQVMPAIHPFTGGARGQGHQTNWHAGDIEDAVLRPARAMALTVIDLLCDGAAAAQRVLRQSTPPYTRRQYLAFLDEIHRVQVFEDD